MNGATKRNEMDDTPLQHLKSLLYLHLVSCATAGTVNLVLALHASNAGQTGWLVIHAVSAVAMFVCFGVNWERQ